MIDDLNMKVNALKKGNATDKHNKKDKDSKDKMLIQNNELTEKVKQLNNKIKGLEEEKKIVY